MTLIVAVDYLDEMVIVADSGISYNGVLTKTYGLLKINWVGNEGHTVPLAFGFAGRVYAGSVITEFIAQKMKNYRRKYVVEHIKEDIRKWIEEAAQTVPKEVVTGTQFLLAGYEPRRRHMINVDGKNVPNNFAPFPFYECHMYTYHVLASGRVEMVRRARIATIGSGKKMEQMLYDHVNDFINIGANMPYEHGANLRDTVLLEWVNEDARRASLTTVSPPYIFYRLQVGIPLRWRFVWSTKWMGMDELDVIYEPEWISVSNKISNERRKLLLLTHWYKYNPQDTLPNALAMA